MAEKNAVILKTYNWDNESAIRQIDVRKSKTGAVAYLHAADDATNLHNLRELLRGKGWATSSDTREGKPVLRVSGLQDENQLINIALQSNFAQGTPRVTETTPPKEKGFWNWVKRNSLIFSGWVYTFGNALYVVSGFVRKDMDQARTGASFAGGDILLAIFGGKNEDRQLRTLLTKLKSHLNTHGITIPDHAAINTETDKGKNSKFFDFMGNNISIFKALAEVVAGVFYFRAGAKQKNPWKQTTAIIFGLGFGSSIFIKEKKTDPNELKNAGFFKKAWAYWQEKPLRIAGWSGLSNTVLTTAGAVEKGYKHEKGMAPPAGDPHYKWDLATAGTMLVANNLYALSNKGAGKITSGSIIDDVYGLAAQVINQQPTEELRNKAIEETAKFLGERTEIKEHTAQAKQHLIEELVRLNNNPWSEAHQKQSPVVTNTNAVPTMLSSPLAVAHVNEEKMAGLQDQKEEKIVLGEHSGKVVKMQGEEKTHQISA